MAARPRKVRLLPHGIKPDALPPYVTWDASGRGRWMLGTYDPQTQRTQARRLIGPDATLRQIWDAWETRAAPPPTDTMAALIGRFEASPQWTDLAETTQRDYRNCAAALLGARTKRGTPLGDTRLSDWTPGAVRSYCERRAESSRSRANHELRYLRRLFAWALERDLMAINPASGVKALREVPRSRYVTDAEYSGFLILAGARYPYLIPIAELAYLSRLRLSEVLDLRRADIREEGMFAARRKGSRDALTGWTERLRAAIDAALALHGQVASVYLIPGHTRGRMNQSTVETAWNRAMVDWAAAGNERFTLHDLKRKGVSDADGDKLAASGHRSLAMLKVYDVLPAKAPATR